MVNGIFAFNNVRREKPEVNRSSGTDSPFSFSFDPEDSLIAEKFEENEDVRTIPDKVFEQSDDASIKSLHPLDSLTRRLAIQNFLKKMEEEFGVKAEQIVTAFSQLPAGDLLKPASESIEKIVNFLGLENEQKDRAIDLFQHLLQQTGTSQLGQYLNNKEKEISFAVVSAEEARKKQISQSFFVDPHSNSKDLNEIPSKENQSSEKSDTGSASPFFVSETFGQFGGVTSSLQSPFSAVPSGEAAVPTLGPTPPSLSTSPILTPAAFPLEHSPSISPADDLVSKDASTGLDFAQEMTSINQSSPVSYSPEISADSLSHSPFPSWGRTMPDGFKEIKTSSFPNREAAGSSGSSVLSETEAPVSSPDAFPVSASSALSSSKFTDHTAEKSPLMDSDQDQEKQEGDLSDSSSLSSLGEHHKNREIKQNSFKIEAPQMTPAQASANVQEVVDQAQVLLKNGGGEMKIKLNPEGMGEITLKVATDGGRVNIEMIASNNDTKKILEKGIGDLRNSFASHSMSVDHIKIGSIEQASKNFDQPLSDHQQRFAQQFMEEFRQNNQSWRQNFFDLPGAKNYRSQTQGSTGDEGSPLVSRSYSSKNQGRRLDLVA